MKASELPVKQEPSPVTEVISVIVPCRNEASTITKCVSCLLSAGFEDVIVVDGDSTDNTVALAEAAGARCVSSPPGRARQMNFGAQFAKGDILFFVHADTLVPPRAGQEICEILADSRVSLGVFRLSFGEANRTLQTIAFAANLRSCIGRTPYGDQGFFCRKAVFDELGGFPDLPIFEDLALVNRAKRLGRLRHSEHSVETDSRRWAKNGYFRTTLLNNLVLLGYLLGVSPDKLSEFYLRLGKKEKRNSTENG